MSLPRKALADGEEIVCDLSPHRKRLVRPVLSMLAIVFVGSYCYFAIPPGGSASIGRTLVLGAAVILLLWWAVWPALCWRRTSYVLTNRRLAVRTGVLTRIGRDVPLGSVTDVSFRRGVLDRLLGCGTLTVAAAGERAELVLTDVPRILDLQRNVHLLLEQE